MSEQIKEFKSLKSKIDSRIALLNQRAKKSLGQNFLIDQNIVDAITNIVKKNETLKWVEIGPTI